MTRQQDGIAVWWVIGIGAALSLLPRGRVARGGIWVLAAFAGLVAWTALALLWTDSDERTLAEIVRVVHYAGIVLLVWLLASATTWRSAAAGLLAAAAAVCAIAVASRLFPEQLPDRIAQAVRTKRLSYPLGYWNAVGAWGAMTVAMALVWSAHARSIAVRAASLAVVPMAAAVIYLSYSRAGLGGTAVALLAALALSVNRWTVASHAAVGALAGAGVIAVIRGQSEIADGTGAAGAAAVVAALAVGALACAITPVVTGALRADRRWRLPRRHAQLATTAVLALCLMAIVTVGRAPLSEAWDDFRETAVAPIPDAQLRDPAVRLSSLEGARYEIWSSAVRALRDEPLRGIGPGTFEFHWNMEGGRLFVRDAHSLYLESAAEVGLLGAGLTIAALLGVVFLAVRATYRHRDPGRAGAAAALTAALIVYLFHAGIDWMWESTAITALALAGGALAAASTTRSRGPTPGWRVRGGLVVLAVCACALALPGLLSTTKLRASRDAFRHGDDPRALELANSAVSRQPWAAEPYVQRALLRWSDGDFDAAARDFDRAREHDPLNWRHPALVARMEADRGRAGPAVRAFREAQALRPASPFLATSGRPKRPRPPPR